MENIETTNGNGEEESPQMGQTIPSQLRELIISQEEINLAKMHRNAGAEFVAGLSPAQKDKLLDIMAKNEDNMFKYHTEKLSATKEVEIHRIKAKGEGVRTFKSIAMGILIVFLVLTMFIGWLIPAYISQWLSFAAGLGGGGFGGYGFAKSKVLDFNKKPYLAAPEKHDENDESD